jgi:hypothetical protein
MGLVGGMGMITGGYGMMTGMGMMTGGYGMMSGMPLAVPPSYGMMTGGLSPFGGLSPYGSPFGMMTGMMSGYGTMAGIGTISGGMPLAVPPMYAGSGMYGSNGLPLTSQYGAPVSPWGSGFTSALNPYSSMPMAMNPQYSAMYNSSLYNSMYSYAGAGSNTNLMMAQQQMYEAQQRYNETLMGSYYGGGSSYGYGYSPYSYGSALSGTRSGTF